MRDDAPWSSKHIIDMLCPPLEESGNPVVCYPVAGYALGVKASWEPTQEGTGIPYPAGGGKNLWGDLIQNTFVSQQGLSSGFSGAKTTGKIPCTEGDNYTLSCATTFAPAPGNVGVLAYFDESDTILTRIANTYQRAFTLTAPANAAYLRASCYLETDADNVQLEKGSTATAYAPYENIRPIKGRDSVKVERCGENVIEFLSINDLNSGIKIAVDAEKNITLNGTIAAKSNIIIGGCRLHWVAGKTYTMHIKKVGGSVSLGSGDGITFAYSLFTTDYEHYFRGDTNSTNIGAYIASNVALVETELVFMLQCWRVGTVFNDFKFQIEVVEGTTTPTTYTPYIGQTNTLTLPETVYGGEVDVVTGEGIKNWKRVVFDGTENWNSRPANYISYSLALPRRAQTGFCTHFKKILYDAIRPDTGTGETGCYLEFSSSAIFNVTFENVTDWKNYLAAQYAAGTPVCIVFQYANEVNEPFTATGAQPIPALVGANTVLTDADSATVTGRADPIKRIEDLEAAVASIN